MRRQRRRLLVPRPEALELRVLLSQFDHAAKHAEPIAISIASAKDPITEMPKATEIHARRTSLEMPMGSVLAHLARPVELGDYLHTVASTSSLIAIPAHNGGPRSEPTPALGTRHKSAAHPRLSPTPHKPGHHTPHGPTRLHTPKPHGHGKHGKGKGPSPSPTPSPTPATPTPTPPVRPDFGPGGGGGGIGPQNSFVGAGGTAIENQVFTDANPLAVGGINENSVIGNGYPASDYRVSISFTGDVLYTGHLTLVATNGADGGYTIFASGVHVGDEGIKAITISAVNIVDGMSGTSTGDLVVTDGKLTAHPIGNFQQFEGNKLFSPQFSGAVATFNDAGSPAPLADYTAIIDWGDGTSSAGVVGNSTQATTFGDNLTVYGGHRYLEDGKYEISVSIADEGGATTSASEVATIAEPGLGLPNPIPRFIEGQPFHGVVAHLYGLDPDASADPDLAAITIDWGDGTTSPGAVSGNDIVGPIGGDSDLSTHYYAEDGQYTITVSFVDDGKTQTTSYPVSALEVPAVFTVGGTGFVTSPPSAAFVTVATGGSDMPPFGWVAFPNPNDSDISITVTWPDGTVTHCLSGFTTPVPSQYDHPGSYTVTVSATDDNVTVSHSGVISLTNIASDPTSYTPGSLRGRAFEGGQPVANQDVQLLGYSTSLNNGQGGYSHIEDTVTDSMGDYLFSGLGAGVYKVAISQPSNLSYETAIVGDLGGTAGLGYVQDIPLLAMTVGLNKVVENGSNYNFPFNSPPLFTSSPPLVTSADVFYNYHAHAVDTDSDFIRYGIVSGPPSMLIDSKSGQLTWTPGDADVGGHQIVISADDGHGGVTDQGYTLRVQPVDLNLGPQFTSSPIIDAYVGEDYIYNATALDTDGDPLAYSLLTPFTGMHFSYQLSPSQGTLSWIPTPAQVGTYQVSIQVDDGRGLTATQTYTINVHTTPNNDPPHIGSDPVTSVVADQTYQYHVTASDDDGDLIVYSLLPGAPGGMTIDGASGQISWPTTDANLGTHSVTVQATDSAGLTDQQQFNILVHANNEVRGQLTGIPAISIGPGTPPGEIKLTRLSPVINTPIAVGYYEPDSSLIVSMNYPGGTPYSFSEVHSDGSSSQFSSVSGLQDEIEMAIAQAGNSGGFATGDIFYGDGVAGQIGRISGRGQTVTDPWVQLPGETSIIRGALTFDNTGIFNGDLIALGESGDVWEITALGVATLLAHLPNENYEGVDVVPNLPSVYGPLAGKIVASVEDASNPSGFYTIDAAGNTQFYNLGLDDIENILVVPPNENFYTIGYTAFPNGALYGAPADEFSGMVGSLLVFQEFPDTGKSGLYQVNWQDNKLNTTPIVVSSDSSAFNQWEHGIFAVAGVDTISSSKVPLEGWTVYDDLTNSGQFQAGDPFGVTDQNGNYVIPNVPSGTAHIKQVMQTGWEVIRPASGDYDLTLSGHQVVDTIDFTDQQEDSQGLNQSPQFSSTPPATATTGTNYHYKAIASDRDGDPLTYDLTVKPDGMVVDPHTGNLNWTPTDHQAGAQSVILRVQDGRGGVALQSFTIQVTDPNTPPIFSTKPVTTVYFGDQYLYEAHAVDSDGDKIAYHLLAPFPSGMSIDPQKGYLTWTAPSSPGTYPIVISADDSHVTPVTQSFTITVMQVPEAGPVIDSTTPPTSAQVDHPYTYEIMAHDDDGDRLSYLLDVYPRGMTVTPDGIVTWTPDGTQGGPNNVSLRVIDSRGNSSAEQVFQVTVGSQAHNDPPTINLSAPPNAVVGQLYTFQAIGSDPDGDPLVWTMGPAPDGMGIDSKSGTIVWTPTAAELGSQTATVWVNDEHGGKVSASFTVTVLGAGLPPQITSNPPLQAGLHAAYSYSVQADSPQGYPLTYAVLAGPSGMAFSTTTPNLLQWPNPTPLGAVNVEIEVLDNQGNSVTQSYALEVTTSPSAPPPQITSTPGTTGAANHPYEYDVTATDPNGNLPITYGLPIGPNNMSINQTTGVLQWTPTQTGQYSIEVSATNSLNATTLQDFVLTVINDNGPTITSTGTATITAGQTYHYAIQASDPDGDPLTYKLLQYPPNMTVDAAGNVTWQVPPATPSDTSILGNHEVKLVAIDSAGVASPPQDYELDVLADTDTTQVDMKLTPDPSSQQVTIYTGQQITILVTAGDDEPLSSVNLTVLDPSGSTTLLPLDARGVATLTPTLAGHYDVTAKATDVDQNWGSIDQPFTVYTPQANSGPSVSLGGGNEVITSPTQITANVTPGAAPVTSYSLTYAPIDGGASVPISSGTSLPANHVFGTFDPTLLPDGSYNVKLAVEDANNNTTTEQSEISVSGKLKLGNFAVSFSDLSLPSQGLPISVTRAYDSLQADRSTLPDGSGDPTGVGPGWRIAESDFDLQVSIPNAEVAGTGGDYPAYTDGTRVTLTRPGADPEGFTFYGQPEYDWLGDIIDYIPTFVPDAGINDTLTAANVSLSKNDDGTYYVTTDAGLSPYNPADPVFSGNGQYTLTARDGTSWVVSSGSGQVQTESDLNGNTLTFNSNGITNNSGEGIAFIRNPGGVITAIDDLKGNSISYGYSSTTGDLTSLTDRDDNKTQLGYSTQFAHNLNQVVDGLGVTAASVAYQSDGRVLGVMDAQGNTSTNGYNIGTLSASVTPPGSTAGHLTFDTNGDPTNAVDPSGATVNAFYDGNNFMTSETQVVGSQTLTTRFTYDAQGDVLSQEDPLGNTSHSAYNQLGEATSLTDPLGGTTQTQFDSAGNILSTTSPTGVSSSLSHDLHGNIVTATSVDGTTHETYNTLGQLVSSTDARGVVTNYQYDANGNPVESDWTWVDPVTGTTQTMTTHYVYDANDRLKQTIAPNGTTSTLYDANGNTIESIDDLGGITYTTYDTDGRVIETQGPDNKITDTVYDAQGRTIWTDDPHFVGQPADGMHTDYDPDGRATGTERYANVLITIVGASPDAVSQFVSHGMLLSSTSNLYDSAGRETQSTDAAGHVVNFVYDNSGHQIEVDDTVNGVARHTYASYDAAGRPASRTDALGNTTQYLYDGDGRLIETIYPDGTTTSDRYDAAGRKIASIDPNGHETDYQYDANGQLTGVLLPGVVDPNNPSGPPVHPTFTYTNDSYGELLSVTDPLGHTSSYDYNAFGNKVSETLTMASQSDPFTETWSYNALDQLASSIDFDGQTISYQYDALGRVNQKADYAHGATTPSELVTYGYEIPDTNNDGGYTDTVTVTRGGSSSTTTSFFDVHGNLVQVASPQGTINYSYDPATGAKTEESTFNTDIQYVYDQLGRLVQVKTLKLDGAILTTPLITTYAYDLNDNLVSTVEPNGVTETRTYDSLNRLVSITDTGPSGVIASFKYALDPSGTRLWVDELGGRRDAYSYDDLGRLIEETITAPGTTTRTIQYTYDLAGNRVEEHDNGAPSGQQVLTYQYDANDRLTTVLDQNNNRTIYTYDDNGSTLTVSGTNVNTVHYTWDVEGRLVQAVVTDHTTGQTHVIVYTYDDAGDRTSETVDGQTTTVLNDSNQAYDQVLEEYAPGGALAATYVRGLDLLFQDRNGAESYFVKDGLGSTRALANSVGLVTDTYSYDAFGNALQHTGTTPNEYLFGGQQFDANSGQLYLRARDYDPVVGRFTSLDTFNGNISNPLTLNKYVYADSDPVDRTDPSGHESLTGLLTNFSIRAIMVRATIGGVLGAADAFFRGYSLKQGIAWGAVFGIAGPLIPFKVGVALSLVGVGEALLDSDYDSALFRSATLVVGLGSYTYLNEILPSGRIGSVSTRLQNLRLAAYLRSKGWRITGGGNVAPEEYIPGPGGGRSGSTYVDITATRSVGDNPRTLRVQTVTTRADGITPNREELAAAARIRLAFPNDKLILVPKQPQTGAALVPPPFGDDDD
jgi:RHS repeat-associated protein